MRGEYRAKKIENLTQRLEGGFFLSALHEYTFGPFCADRAAGCVMVQTGLYFAEPEADEAVRSRCPNTFLPDECSESAAFLAEDIRQAKSKSEVVVCMNLGALSLQPGLQAAQTFLEAGGDLVELNIHGGFIRYMQAGRMRAMMFRENQTELFRWVEAYLVNEIPLLVKFNPKDHRAELMEALHHLSQTGLLGIHINVRSEGGKKPDLDLIAEVKEHYPGFLLVSGYLRSVEDVHACFQAGANMVGIGEPAMQDPGFITRLAAAYRSG